MTQYWYRDRVVGYQSHQIQVVTYGLFINIEAEYNKDYKIVKHTYPSHQCVYPRQRQQRVATE